MTAAPTIELSEAFLRDPGPVYEQLRSRGPVHHVRFPTGLTGWLVTDYNLAKQVLGDPTIRKDVHHFRRIVDTAHPELSLPGALRSDMASHMLNTDPRPHPLTAAGGAGLHPSIRHRLAATDRPDRRRPPRRDAHPGAG